MSILSDLQSNGTFSLDRAEIARIDGGQALSDGTHTLHLIATDQVSRVSPEYDVTFTLDDQSPTLVLAGLADGTITNKNPALTGTVTDNLSGVQALTAQVNGGTPVALSFNGTTGALNFTTALKTDGTADGRHTIVLHANDVAGNAVSDTLDFTLKTIPPAQPTFALAAADQENGSPLSTTNSQVTLTGHTESNVNLEIVKTGVTAQSTNTGDFQFPGVPLALGDQHVDGHCDGRGREHQPVPGDDRARSVDRRRGPGDRLERDRRSRRSRTTASTADVASRGLAMVLAAVYDAVNAIDGTPAYYVKLTAPADASVDAAVALGRLHGPARTSIPPSRQPRLPRWPPDWRASRPARRRTDGESVGQAVANAIIAMRANDGSTNYVDLHAGHGAGRLAADGPGVHAPRRTRSGRR